MGRTTKINESSNQKKFEKKESKKGNNIEQIIDDVDPKNSLKNGKKKQNEDKEKVDEYFCIFCSKYFVNKRFYNMHNKSNYHKKKVKESRNKLNNTKLFRGKLKFKKPLPSE